jgi:peroxiredoxin
VQLHQPDKLAQLEKMGARLLVISFGKPERYQKFPEHFREHYLKPVYEEIGKDDPHPFRLTTFLSDPERHTYRAYGLGKLSAVEAYGPQVLLKYARWAVQGRKINAATEDTLQRGGNFVISVNQRITLAHSGRNQLDRPSPAVLLQALRKG